MKSDVRSAFFMLERRFSSDFGKQSVQNVKMTSENVNMNFETKTEARTAEQIRLEILAKLAPRNRLIVEE